MQEHPQSTITDDAEVLLERFEAIYRDSDGDPARIPWAHAKPCPWLVSWLNAEAPSLVRAGARTAVVGCGLGNDAALLAERGYEVFCSAADAHFIWDKILEVGKDKGVIPVSWS